MEFRKFDAPNLLRHYSDAPVPPPSKRGRIAGQILNSAIGGSSAHRAGASGHRYLSQRQTNLAIDFARQEMAKDTLVGTLSFIVITTGFSVDLAAELDLLSAVQTTDWTATLRAGVVQASREETAGCAVAV